MKKALALLLLLAVAPLHSEDYELKLPKGIVSAYDALPLSEDFVPDAQNVFFDADLGVKKRGGYDQVNTVSYGSQTVRDMYGFIPSTLTVSFSTNSIEYLVLFSGSTMAYALNGGSTFTVVITTLNANFPVDCATEFGQLWCVNGDRNFAWAGGTRTISLPPEFPVGTNIEGHANRLWVIGVPGNESIVYGSKFLDGLTWALGGNAGDPVQIPIGSRDGTDLSCMKSYSDSLWLGKSGPPGSLWAVSGKSQNDFQLNNLSKQVGCVDDRTVQEKQGKLYWMSARGIERWAGGLSDPPFGDPVKNITDGFRAGSSVSNQSFVGDDTQSEFLTGISTYVELYAEPGLIRISSPIFTATGTFNTESHQWRYGGGNTLSDFIAYNFTVSTNTNLLGVTGRHYVDNFPSDQIYFLITFLSSSHQSGLREPAYNSRLANGTTIQIGANTLTGFIDFFSSYTPYPLVAGTTYWVGWGGHSTDTYSGLAVYQHRSSVVHSYNLRVYNTSSNGGVTWNVASDRSPVLYVDLSSAQFTSSSKDLGDNVSRIGDFTGTQILNDGVIYYFVRSAATEDALLTASWVAQTLGSGFAASANQFIQWRAEFGKFTSSGNPVIQDVSIEYYTTTNKPKMASWVVDGRYYLSGSTNTVATTFNETIIVVDKFDNFSRLNGMNAESFASAFGNDYFGTSQSTQADGGYYFRMTDTFLDRGTPINAYVTFKDNCFGNCAQDKTFDKVFVYTKNDGSGGGTLSTTFNFNRDGTSNSLGDVSLTEATGLIFSRVVFPMGNYGVMGKSLRLTFSNNEASRDFSLLGARVFYTPEPIQ